MTVKSFTTEEKYRHSKACDLAQMQLESARRIVGDKLTSLTSAQIDAAAATLALAIATNYAALSDEEGQ